MSSWVNFGGLKQIQPISRAVWKSVGSLTWGGAGEIPVAMVSRAVGRFYCWLAW
jgi:hypothetical protein